MAADTGRVSASSLQSAAMPLMPAALLLSLLYTLAALLSLSLSRSPEQIASLWYANAIAVAFTAHRPWRELPALLLATAAGIFVANAIWGDPLATAWWFIPPNLAEVALATWLIKRAGLDSKALDDPARLSLLLALGSGLAPLAGALVGSVLLPQALATGAGAIAWPWVAGAVVGGASAMPLAFLLYRGGIGVVRSLLYTPLFWGLLASSVGTTVVVFAYLPFPFVYATIPLLVAAMTLPMAGTALITLTVSVTLGALMVTGTFVPPPTTREWQQVFVHLAIAAALVPAQILAAAQSAFRSAQERLGRSAASLQQSNQGLQQFIRMASHDLREPVNTVSQFTGLLSETHAPQWPPDAREHLQRVASGADRMRGLLDDVVLFATLSQLDSIEARPVDLDACLMDARLRLADHIRQRQALLTTQPLPVVMGDAQQLGLLLTHLLSNALKFVPPERSPVIEVRARIDHGMAVVTITDNGCGIDPAYAERLFEPFARLHTRRQNGGSGLGLAVCRQIARLHQGAIDIRPAHGLGTEVQLRLPFA